MFDPALEVDVLNAVEPFPRVDTCTDRPRLLAHLLDVITDLATKVTLKPLDGIKSHRQLVRSFVCFVVRVCVCACGVCHEGLRSAAHMSYCLRE